MGTTAEKLSYLKQTKAAIKTAIQGKGVAVAYSDTFRSYAQKIAGIETKPTLAGTAQEQDVLSGKTFYSGGYTIKTGSMGAYSGTAYQISPTTHTVAISKGYHDGTTMAKLPANYAMLPYSASIADVSADDWDLYSWQELHWLRRTYNAAKVSALFLGKTKTLVVDNQTCTARLVGTSGGGLVFHVTGMTSQQALFNSGLTTGGWGSCPFRQTLNGSIYNTLPEQLRTVIQDTSVTYGISSASAGKVTTTSACTDKLFVPSLTELKGNSHYTDNNGNSVTDWNITEGMQFAWYAQDVNHIKTASRAMTRSVPQTNRYAFVEANSTQAGVIWLSTATTVNFCFVI